MPKIPQYGEPQVQERPLSLPGTNPEQPLSAFGGGQALDEVTGQAVGLAMDIQHREMQRYKEHYQDGVNLQALEIGNKLTAEATRAKNALAQQGGKSAIGGRDRTLEGYDKFYEGIEKDIQNPDVKKYAYAHYLQHKQGLDSFATPYEAAQIKEYDNNEILSELKMNQEAASADPRPENIAPLSMGSKLAWEEFGKRNDWSPRQIAEKQQEIGSSIHLAALKSISASKQYAKAKEFFSANEEEFIGNDLVQAKAIVTRDTVLGDAYGLSDAVMAKRPATISEAMGLLDSMTKNAEPEVRQHAESLLTRRYELMKAGEKEATDQTFQQASKLINQPENYGKLPWEVIDSATWLSLPDNDRKALIASSYALMRPMKEGDDSPGVTEWYAQSNDAISKLSPADMERWRAKLTKSNFDKFAESWGKIRRGEDDLSLEIKQEDRKYLFTNAKNGDLMGLGDIKDLEELGDKTKEKFKEKSRAFEDGFREVIKRMDVATKNKGSKLSGIERREIIDSYLLAQPKKQGFFENLLSVSPEMRAYTDTITRNTSIPEAPNYRPLGANEPVLQVSDLDKDRINKSIKRATGKDGSDEKILKLKRAEQAGATPEELRKLINQ